MKLRSLGSFYDTSNDAAVIAITQECGQRHLAESHPFASIFNAVTNQSWADASIVR